jgi:hypothetical protein
MEEDNSLIKYCNNKTIKHDIEIIKKLANETTINQTTKNGYNALICYLKKTNKINIEIVKILANEKTINHVTND